MPSTRPIEHTRRTIARLRRTLRARGASPAEIEDAVEAYVTRRERDEAS